MPSVWSISIGRISMLNSSRLPASLCIYFPGIQHFGSGNLLCVRTTDGTTTIHYPEEPHQHVFCCRSYFCVANMSSLNIELLCLGIESVVLCVVVVVNRPSSSLSGGETVSVSRIIMF